MSGSFINPAASPGAKTADGSGVEAAERGAKVVPLAQDREPAEPRHEAFEDQLLEQPLVVGHGPAPFEVVVAAVQIVGIRPPAPGHTIGADADAGRSGDRLRSALRAWPSGRPSFSGDSRQSAPQVSRP